MDQDTLIRWWKVVLTYVKDGKSVLMEYTVEADNQKDALLFCYQEVLRDVKTHKISIKEVPTPKKQTP